MSQVWKLDNYASHVHFTTAGLTGGVHVDTYQGEGQQLHGPSLPPVPHIIPTTGAFTIETTRGLVNSICVQTAADSETAKTIVTDLGSAVRLTTQGVTGTFSGNFCTLRGPSWSPEYWKWDMVRTYRLSADGNPFYWEYYNPLNITIKVRNGIIWHWSDNAGKNVQSASDRVVVSTTATNLTVTGAGITSSFTYTFVDEIETWLDPYYMLMRGYITAKVVTISVEKGLVQSIGTQSLSRVETANKPPLEAALMLHRWG